MGLVELLGLWRSREVELWRTDIELYTSTGEQMLKLGEPLMAYDVIVEGLRVLPKDVRLRQLYALALLRAGVRDKAETILLGLEEEGQQDEETIGLLARIHKERWDLEKRDSVLAARELTLAHEYYQRAYDLAGGYWSGINAATTALLLERGDVARTVAHEVRERCLQELEAADVSGKDIYWFLATLAEAALILEEVPEAESLYRSAAEVGRRKFGNLVSSRQNAILILDHFGISKTTIEEILGIPPVVVFSIHLADYPDSPTPQLQPELEVTARNAILERLYELKPAFGYASIASHSDMLFLESMIEIGADVHVVLPYSEERLVKENIDLAHGGTWKSRFDNILERATEVLTASDLRQEDREVSYEYANVMLYGLAATRARQLRTQLVPMTLSNGEEANEIDASRDSESERVFEVQVEVTDESLILENAASSNLIRTTQPGRQEIKKASADFIPRIMSMLFADALHFSSLNDKELPFFLNQFLGTIAELLRRTAYKPVMKNTWGDGLYMVFSGVDEAGGFALELCDLINQTRWEDRSLPAELNLRIALHAGPVFECIDPVTEVKNFIGSQVSRAARIEPITPPGQVYASQAFAALAAAQGMKNFVCDYVGQVPQAKGYGTFPTYHVRRSNSRERELVQQNN